MRAPFQLVVLIAAVALAASLAAPSNVHAQAAEQPARGDGIPPDFKGTIGLGLIGAELGMVVPALAGLHDTWAFIVFPVLGGAGGAVAGYFLLEQGNGEPELAVAALTAGMALAIPALLVTLAATAYQPEQQKPLLTARHSPGLVRVSDGSVQLAAPGIGIVPVGQAREVRVALLSGLF